jgi:hypothetical protein
MTDEIISNLPEATSAADTQVFPVEDGISTKKMTLSTLGTFLGNKFNNAYAPKKADTGSWVMNNGIWVAGYNKAEVDILFASKLPKRAIVMPTVTSYDVNIPASNISYSTTININIDNLPSWFTPGTNTFLECRLQYRLYANTTPTSAQLPYGQYVWASWNPATTNLENNIAQPVSLYLQAGVVNIDQHVLLNAKQGNFQISFNAANPTTLTGFRAYVFLTQATAYQYPA